MSKVFCIIWEVVKAHIQILPLILLLFGLGHVQIFVTMDCSMQKLPILPLSLEIVKPLIYQVRIRWGGVQKFVFLRSQVVFLSANI